MLSEGVEFPPLSVVFDGSAYWLVDGFHRRFAAVKAKLDKFKCVVTDGTREDARWLSYGANKDHGLKRTNDDKQKAVIAALKHPSGMKLSDGKIAEHVGVSDRMVAKYRPQAGPKVSEVTEREGRDGKTYTTRTKKCISQSDMPQEPDETPEPVTQISGGATFDPVEIETVTANQAELFAAKVRQQNSAIESFARALMAAFDNPPSDPWLDDSRLNIARDQIRSACSTIRLAKAHDKQCPKCDGSGSMTGKPCRACRGCGYLPKSSYEAMGGQ